MINVRHFKLVTNEEVICQVMDYTEPVDGDTKIVIRNPLKLLSVIGPDKNSFHTLVPWMLYQISENNVISLNINQIVAEAIPNEKMLENYESILEKIMQSEDEEFDYDDSDEISIDDLIDSFTARSAGKIH